MVRPARACTVLVGSVALIATLAPAAASDDAASHSDRLDSPEGWALATDDGGRHSDTRGGIKIVGRGYGHGIGMSQYGAEGAARKGVSFRKIVRYYYPGTKFRQRRGFIRVHITDDTSPGVTVRSAPKLRVRDLGDGKRFRLPSRKAIRAWRVVPAKRDRSRSAVQFRTRSGWHRWRVPGRGLLRGDAAFRRPGTIRLVLPGGTTRRYRGGLRSASPSPDSRGRDTVNVLGMQNYLKGVVAVEMPAYWSQQALRAQTVAARSYALYLKNDSRVGHYDLCDTTTCQVYDGYGAETDATNKAVRATVGVTVVHAGKPALTMFSSSSGGWTDSGGLPYLRAHKDRFDRWSGNPMRKWTVQLRRAEITDAYPSLGRLKSLKVTERNGHGAWNGRVERIVLRGTRNRITLSGADFQSVFGLRSDWFRIG